MDIRAQEVASQTSTSAAASIKAAVPQSFGFKLRRVQLAYNRLFLQFAGPDCIPINQIGALSLIARNGGITPGELAALLTIEAAQLTPLIKQLEARALIRRERSATDNRSYSLHATDLGVIEYKRLQEIIAAVDETFVAKALHAGEAAQLSDMLDRVMLADRNRARPVTD